MKESAFEADAVAIEIIIGQTYFAYTIGNKSIYAAIKVKVTVVKKSLPSPGQTSLDINFNAIARR